MEMSKHHPNIQNYFMKIVKDKMGLIGFLIIITFLVVALLAPIISPYDPYEQNLPNKLSPPSKEHLLGTDEFGRDVLSRIIFGARTSLEIAFLSTSIALVIGVTFGTLSGFYGGIVDSILMRLMDIFLAFPGMILALAIISIVGPGLIGIIIATSVYSIPQFARVSRASVISVKENDYVEGARAIGESNVNIVLRYILPNIWIPIMVLMNLRIGVVIIIASSLSFLGLGIQPPIPEWGIMVNEARFYFRLAPYLSIFPGIALVLLIVGFNLLGNGIKNVFIR